MAAQYPVILGSTTGIVAANGTPSGQVGFATAGQRFINVWYSMSAGSTSVTTRIWLWRELIGWVLYSDIPTTTILTANQGGVIQLESRGAQRIYVELITFVGSPTVGIYVDGVTY